jgi:hypothetical protein
MKTYLVFHKNGDISEKHVNYKMFNLDQFEEFSSFKRYNKYIVLYNSETDKNITIFPFTEDIYFGDIALILLDKNDKIIKLNLEMYSKKLQCNKCAQNEMYFSSDDDSEFI